MTDTKFEKLNSSQKKLIIKFLGPLDTTFLVFNDFERHKHKKAHFKSNFVVNMGPYKEEMTFL